MKLDVWQAIKGFGIIGWNVLLFLIASGDRTETHNAP